MKQKQKYRETHGKTEIQSGVKKDRRTDSHTDRPIRKKGRMNVTLGSFNLIKPRLLADFISRSCSIFFSWVAKKPFRRASNVK